MKRYLLPFMRVEWVRGLVLAARYFWFVHVLRRLRVLEAATESVSANTVQYNLTAFKRPLVLRRTNVLLRPFSVIESLGPDSAVLVVGPRSEDDLLQLAAYGFRNVRGLDLISYSPHIDLGDMHRMPYADNQFDAILFGWVLVYSDDPARAVREAIRVVKDGGIVGIGAEHYPGVPNRAGGEAYSSVGGKRINTAAAHLGLFGDCVGKVHFTHDVGDAVLDRMTNTALILTVRKR